MDIERYTPETIITRKKKVQKIKNIFIFALYIILIPIILCNLFLIFQSIFYFDKTPSIFGLRSYVIVSGSMEPTINIGDVIIVKIFQNNSNYEVNDIISYHENNSVVTHRIVKVEKLENDKVRYITKGDNNNTYDNFVVEQSNVDGKVIKIIPKIGYLSLFIENHIFLLITFILFYAFVSSNIKKVIRRKRREQKRKEYEICRGENFKWRK